MTRAWGPVLVLLLGVALTSCDALEPRPARVTVWVEPGARPVIDWTPDGAESVAVYRGVYVDEPSAAPVWRVTAGDGTNGLRGPLTYGDAPAGSTTTHPALPLESGLLHTVRVRRADWIDLGVFGEHEEAVGTATFTP